MTENLSENFETTLDSAGFNSALGYDLRMETIQWNRPTEVANSSWMQLLRL